MGDGPRFDERSSDRPDMAALTGAPTPSTFDPAASSRLATEFAPVQRGKMEETAGVTRQMEATIDEDRARMVKQFDAMGDGPDKLKPWNAAEEHKKFETEPLQAFASLGSVFGIVASAFTHAPMANALNASAAAMNAVHENDEKGYARAYEAYKNNMDLVQKRHNMQHQLYQDASHLMTTDMGAWAAKVQNIATRFGDTQMQFLLNNGLYKEAIELNNSRAQAMTGMVKAGNEFNAETIKKRQIETDPVLNNPNSTPAEKGAALRQILGAQAVTIQEQIWNKYIAEYAKSHNGAFPPAKDMAQFAQDSHLLPRNYGANTNANSTQARDSRTAENIKADVQREHPNWTPGQIDKEVNRQLAESKARPTTPALTKGRIEAQEIKRRQEAYVKAGMEPGDAFAQAEKEVGAIAAHPTGNRLLTEMAHIDKYTYAIDEIGGLKEMISKHTGAVGAFGYATRLGERLGNIMGSNETDRAAIQHKIQLLQVWANENLTDRAAGRPLSQEEKNMKSIIAGLSLGDTTKNVLRQFDDIEDLYKKMRDGAVSRLKGNWKPPPTSSENPQPGTPRKGPAWMQAPVKGGGTDFDPQPKRTFNYSDEDVIGMGVENIPEGMSTREALRR